jgi:D-arabinose 1-dehydrogenase-like Zn-dependent alcohol dehydrogenase
VGLFGGEITLSTVFLPWRAIAIQGSYVGSPSELGELMAMATAGKVPLVPVTRHPLHEATHTLERLRAGLVIGRAILVP